MFSKIKTLIKSEKHKKEEEAKGLPVIIDSFSEKIALEPLNFQFNYSTPDLKDFKIPNLDTAYYFPSLISLESEEKLLKRIYSKENENRWINLTYSARRLQKYGGEVSSNGLTKKEDLPDFLKMVGNYLTINNFFPPKEEKQPIELNHCLVNEYLNGIGIMPHTDGPLYYPYVMILSLGSHCVFNFYEDYSNYKSEEPLAKLLIEPRSLLIFKDQCYSKYLHCIEDKTTDLIWIKYDQKKNIKESNIKNAFMTEIWKNASGESGKQNDSFFFEENIRRNKRISITIRHVPTN